MKTISTFNMTIKHVLLAFFFSVCTSVVLFAQPIYTQNTSDPALCDGAASLDSSFASLPVVWTSANAMGTTFATNVFSVTNLCAGDYIVTFNNPNGVSMTVLFTIGSGGGNVPCANFFVDMITTPTDPNNCTGTASLNMYGGTAPYSVTWNMNTVMGNPAMNLCAGNYSAVVIDANGCAFTATGTVGTDNGNPNPSGDTIIIILNNTYPPNMVTDSLPTTVVTDCNIDHLSVASASITNVEVVPAGVLVTWTIYDAAGVVLATYEIPYYNLTTNGGVYQATLIIFCDGRDVNSFEIHVTDQFIYTPASAGLCNPITLQFNCLNPIEDELRIQFDQMVQGQITMHDMNGRIIFNDDLNAAEYSKSMSDLTSGVYVVVLKSEFGISTVKLVK